MLSKREKLLIRPWEMQRYKNHKRKVQSARPAIDDSPPAVYSHITTKMKKLQAEKERLEKIKNENVRLLQRLGGIMSTKRLENFWQHPRPNFLNREKIYTERPKTCKGRLETVKADSLQSTEDKMPRCLACSGKSIKRNQVVPAERIPWEPPKKSWNKKILANELSVHKCCAACCC